MNELQKRIAELEAENAMFRKAIIDTYEAADFTKDVEKFVTDYTQEAALQLPSVGRLLVQADERTKELEAENVRLTEMVVAEKESRRQAFASLATDCNRMFSYQREISVLFIHALQSSDVALNRYTSGGDGLQDLKDSVRMYREALALFTKLDESAQ
jgi:hypothetical protein